MKKNYKTKRRSAWLTLVLLMITALPINAQNVVERFQVGELWYEVVDATKHTVKVTYANDKAATSEARAVNLSYDWADIANNEMKGYKGELNGKITIPDKVNYNSVNWTVVAIGTCAFINERGNYKKGDIELEIVLPETIEHIEEAAFYQCIVWNINFPQNLKTIGRQAFYKGNLCYSYRYRNPQTRQGRTGGNRTRNGITIPGQTAIGPQAFEECSANTGKRSILSCPNITYVGYQAFKGSGIQIEVPKSANLGVKPTDKDITDMYKNLPAGTDQRSGVEAFAQSPSKSVTLQDGITTIPTGMFEGAFKDLAQFVIPLTVTTIEERAFANAGIKSYNDLSVVKRIGARAFENGALFGDFVVLDNVEEIGNEAFKGNVNLTGFTLKGSANCTVGAGFLEGCPIEYLDLRDVNSTAVKNNLTNLSRAANSTTITAGLPVNAIVYLPKVSGIGFADGQDVNFVKSDGRCTKLLLEDGTEYEFPYAITANEVVYNRDFSGFSSGKNCFTIFLPYAVTLPTGIRAYNLDLLTTRKTGKQNDYGIDITEEVYVFKSIPDGSTLEANRPYLLRVTDGGTHNSQEFNAINSPVEIAASGNDKYDEIDGGRLKPKFFTPGETDQSFVFTGSTEKVPRVTPKATWYYNPWTLGRDKDGNDVWKRMPDKTGFGKLIPPFRGMIMLKPTSSTANEFVLLDEDNQTTGINDVTNDADAQQGTQRIYTMDGRYVGTNFDSLPSGMYIMKGKKTLKTK